MDEAVTTALEELRGYREHHTEVAEYVMGPAAGPWYMMDFLAGAALNRSLALLFGFCSLVEAKNFLAAAPLVRLQLDSCLRFSAAWYAPRPNEVADKIFKGAQVRNLKDRDGNKMTDGYLVKKLAVRYPWVSDVYEHTSGFVHLSEKHIFNALRAVDQEERMAVLKVSDQDAWVPPFAYLEAIEGFKEITVVLLGVVKAYGDLKRQGGDPQLVEEPE